MPIAKIVALNEDNLQHDDDVEFARAFNQDMVALNVEIEAFNQMVGADEDKLSQLKKIDQKRNKLNNLYHLNDIARSSSYQTQMHDQLDREIREELDRLSPPEAEDLVSLPEIIRQMPYEKLSQLMAILWENTDIETKLDTLYQLGDSGYTEFQEFITNHTIESLSAGMASNSRNIKICKKGPGHIPLILKVDARFGLPKSIEDSLRESNVSVLAATYGERQGIFSSTGVEAEILSIEPSEAQKQQVMNGHKILFIRRGGAMFIAYRSEKRVYTDDIPIDGISINDVSLSGTIKNHHDGIITNTNDLNLISPFLKQVLNISTPLVASRTMAATLVITEYCPYGDLYAHTSLLSEGDRLSSILDYYKQMADFLLELQSHEIAFPDAKNQNWLVGADKKLRISDTKSFRRTTERRVSLFSEEHHPRSFPVRSPTHLPSELSTEFTPEFSADAMHVYMLGKNLYQALIGCSAKDLRAIKSLSYTRDFNHPIFQKIPTGEVLKILISSIVQDKPDKRKISLRAAQRLLDHLCNNGLVADQIDQLLKKIKATSISSPDLQMETFIKEQMEKIIEAFPEGLDMIKQELERLHTNLQQIAPSIATVQNSSFSSKMYRSLSEAAIQFTSLPVTDRGDTERVEKAIGIKLTEVKTISLIDQHFKQIEDGLDKIRSTATLRPDSMMDAFIRDQKENLPGKTPMELAQIARDLNQLYDKLQPIASAVDGIVRGLKGARFYRESRSEKVTKITNAFRSIPVTERVNVLTNRQNEKVKDFQNALAWHRTAANKDELNARHQTAEQLTDKTAAKTFKDFRDKFTKIVHHPDSSTQVGPSPNEQGSTNFKK